MTPNYIMIGTNDKDFAVQSSKGIETKHFWVSINERVGKFYGERDFMDIEI